MLKPATYPDRYPRLARMEAMQECAAAIQKPFKLAPLFINFQQFENGVNHVGVPQTPCVNCGDCMTGCNYGAKNTVLMNYLPDAAKHGAEIYTQLSVRHVERRGERWAVHCVDGETHEPVVLETDVVILAAGTLGSTEILLRSGEAGLLLSPHVGSRFSGNGDMLGLAYNADREMRAVGMGTRSTTTEKPIGPATTEMIDLRDGRDVKDGMVFIVSTFPGAIAPFLPKMLEATALLTGTDTDRGWRDRLREIVRVIKSKLFGARTGAVNNTMDCLVMVHDDATGQLYLEKDRVRVRWPRAGEQPLLKQAAAWIRRAAQAWGGTYIPNPVWNELTDHNLITGHPLGGCPMADDSARGVVNHKGQVYDGQSRDSVHRGLYVMDGAVVPTPLGVNPALAISALAERSCFLLAQDYGWTIAYDDKRKKPAQLEIAETLH